MADTDLLSTARIGPVRVPSQRRFEVSLWRRGGGLLGAAAWLTSATIIVVKRVSVVGNSGSGKTTLSRRLGAALGVSHVELDAIFHQPGWTELSTDEFRQRVATELGSEDGWVIDGNYGAVCDLVWAEADTVVWLDLPKRTVMRRLIQRTIRRAVTREELWNGNRGRSGACFDATLGRI